MEYSLIEKLQRYETESRDIKHTLEFLEILEDGDAELAIGSRNINSSYFVPLSESDLPDNFLEKKKGELELRLKTLENAKQEIYSILNKL